MLRSPAELVDAPGPRCHEQLQRTSASCLHPPASSPAGPSSPLKPSWRARWWCRYLTTRCSWRRTAASGTCWRVGRGPWVEGKNSGEEGGGWGLRMPLGPDLRVERVWKGGEGVLGWRSSLSVEKQEGSQVRCQLAALHSPHSNHNAHASAPLSLTCSRGPDQGQQRRRCGRRGAGPGAGGDG